MKQLEKRKLQDKNKIVTDFLLTELVPTEKALRWILTYGNPICCPDFLGYVAKMHPTKSIYVACDLWSNIQFFSRLKVKQKPLRAKWVKKWFEALQASGFLELNVFEEFRTSYQLPINTNNTFFSDEFMFDQSYKGFEL